MKKPWIYSLKNLLVKICILNLTLIIECNLIISNKNMKCMNKIFFKGSVWSWRLELGLRAKFWTFGHPLSACWGSFKNYWRYANFPWKNHTNSVTKEVWGPNPDFCVILEWFLRVASRSHKGRPDLERTKSYICLDRERGQVSRTPLINYRFCPIP